MPVKMLFDIYLFCRQEAYEPSCIGLFMRAVPGIDSQREASWIGGRRETAIGFVGGTPVFDDDDTYSTYSIHKNRYTGIDSTFRSIY